MFYYRFSIGLARPTRGVIASITRQIGRDGRQTSRLTMNGIMQFLLLHKRGRRRGRLYSIPTLTDDNKYNVCIIVNNNK